MKYDNIHDLKDTNTFLCKICMVFIWIMYLYSCLIQYKYIQIPNAMLITGAMILIAFVLCVHGEKLTIASLFSVECGWMMLFMIYIFIFGSLYSPNQNYHITQCITSTEYLFVMLVMVYIISRTSTDSFQILLIVASILLGFVLIREPILYTTGRYSISEKLNPNYLGMCFSASIWSVLYFQQKGKVPLIVSFLFIVFWGYCILQTGSRKAFIATALIVLLWLVFCFYPSLMNVSNTRKIIYLVLCIGLLFLVIELFIAEYSNSTIAKRMDNLQDEATTGERSQLYRLGWDLFKQHPLVGSGFSGFISNRGEHSHATFIEVPVSGGIIGTIIYFYSYIVSISKIVMMYKKCKTRSDLYIELYEVKMLLVLWVVMIFYCTCVIHPHQFLSFILFGIIFGKSSCISRKIDKIMFCDKNITRSRLLNGRYRYIKN